MRAREAEDKRRDRALLLRYPSRAVHDQERTTALNQVDEVIKASSKRTTELAEQRKALNAEMEFYVKDPSKAPPALQRRIEENDSSAAVQKGLLPTSIRKRNASTCGLTKSWSNSSSCGRWPAGCLPMRLPAAQARRTHRAATRLPQKTDF
ncbi:hypothetical protein LP416_15605 [Polaromonas sp. P2-4]|nr:hypothetical protein LP416_15605 [Polaromonas sp. P2-4]